MAQVYSFHFCLFLPPLPRLEKKGLSDGHRKVDQKRTFWARLPQTGRESIEKAIQKKKYCNFFHGTSITLQDGLPIEGNAGA